MSSVVGAAASPLDCAPQRLIPAPPRAFRIGDRGAVLVKEKVLMIDSPFRHVLRTESAVLLGNPKGSERLCRVRLLGMIAISEVERASYRADTLLWVFFDQSVCASATLANLEYRTS